MDFTFIYHIYRHCDFIFSNAIRIGTPSVDTRYELFFIAISDAVNMHLVTMIFEYVCSCDNIILKKKENMQSLTKITRNNKEQHEIWTKTKDIILKINSNATGISRKNNFFHSHLTLV